VSNNLGYEVNWFIAIQLSIFNFFCQLFNFERLKFSSKSKRIGIENSQFHKGCNF